MTIIIDAFLETLSGYDKTLYGELIDFIISLGYRPVRTKTRVFTIDFMNSKSHKIMKIKNDDGKPRLLLKYYAAKTYTSPFRDSIKRVIEEFGGKYTGCYGCGKCQGKPQGYIYTYADGKQVFRCGKELIEVSPVDPVTIKEIKILLRAQNEYFINTTK